MWSLHLRCDTAIIAGIYNNASKKTTIFKRPVSFRKGRLSEAIRSSLDDNSLIFRELYIRDLLEEHPDIGVYSWLRTNVRDKMDIEFNSKDVLSKHIDVTFKFYNLDDAFKFRMFFGEHILINSEK